MIRMPPPPTGDAEAQAIRNARADLARTALAFLLASPASLPLEFTAAGEAESDEGKADVIEVKGAGNFAAQIAARSEKPSPADADVSRRAAARHRPEPAGSAAATPAPARRGARRGRRRRRAAGAAVVDITLYLDDYRSVDGVMLPHRMSRSIDGKPAEETTFKTIKLNPAFKADTFAAR